MDYFVVYGRYGFRVLISKEYLFGQSMARLEYIVFIKSNSTE